MKELLQKVLKYLEENKEGELLPKYVYTPNIKRDKPNCSGLCSLIHTMKKLGELTENEYVNLSLHIKLNRPNTEQSFSWARCIAQPRIDWLNEQIKLN